MGDFSLPRLITRGYISHRKTVQDLEDARHVPQWRGLDVQATSRPTRHGLDGIEMTGAHGFPPRKGIINGISTIILAYEIS